MREKYIARCKVESCGDLVIFGVMFDPKNDVLTIGGPHKFQSDMMDTAVHRFEVGSIDIGFVYEGRRIRMKVPCSPEQWERGIQRLKHSYNVVSVLKFNRLMR
jgi:hypothetical protein